MNKNNIEAIKKRAKTIKTGDTLINKFLTTKKVEPKKRADIINAIYALSF
jgi:hypothetical protein